MSGADIVPAAAALSAIHRPSRRAVWLGALAGTTAAALAMVPGMAEASLPPGNGLMNTTMPALNAGIAALCGVAAAWVGWAVDSWARRLALLTAALALAASQSFLLSNKWALGWEPFSCAAALTAGLLTAGLLTPRGAGVERYFQGRLNRVTLQHLAAAQSADFLLPDQREAAVLTCRMLNETALREQMSAREFLKLMAAFRLTAARTLIGHGALLDTPESGHIRAFFGLPLALENHADKAAAAALALSEALRRFAADSHAPVQCGTGLACGILTAGVTGGHDYSAAGDAVEQSRWLAGLNADYGTLILTDDATHRLADNTEDRPLEILNPPEGAAVEVFHLLATRGGLSDEALARRDAFRDAIILLRAGHAEDALRRFEDARAGLVHEDAALDRFVSHAEHQAARDQHRKPPPPARPRARFSPRRLFRP